MSRSTGTRRCRRRRPAAIATVMLGLAGCGVLAGCGHPASRSGATPPRPGSGAAEPAIAPPVNVPPAARLLVLGGMPEGIAFDPRSRLVAVGLRDPARLVLVDPQTRRVVHVVALAAGPRHLQIAMNAGIVLVPEEDARAVAEVALPSGAVLQSIAVGRQPHDATSAVGGRVFVGDEFSGDVSVIDAGRVVAKLGGLRQPGGLAVAGRTVAVVDVGAHTLTTIDAVTLRREATLAAGSGPTHVVVDARGRLVVVDTRGDALDLYAPSPLALIARVPLTGTPYGIASDPSRKRLWVTLTARNQLVEFRVTATGLRRVATFATGRQPNTVTVDGVNGEPIVANRTDGTIEILPKPPQTQRPR